MMNRLPNAADLTSPEFHSLLLVAPGFMSATIPRAHQARLIELGLIQSRMGGLMATPAGHMVARSQTGERRAIITTYPNRRAFCKFPTPYPRKNRSPQSCCRHVGGGQSEVPAYA